MPTVSIEQKTAVLVRRHVRRWHNCTACPLGASATHHVFFRGTLPCDIAFVGEAPGESEDLTGEPFVGPAGRILDGIIQRSVQNLFSRHTAAQGAKLPEGHSWFTYSVCNLLCCRPPDNRNPSSQEMEACRPRLLEFLSLAAPQYLILLGKFAEEHAPRTYTTTQYKGGRPSAVHVMRPEVLCWYHPAYLLRKGRAFQDQMTSRYAIQLVDAALNLVPF